MKIIKFAALVAIAALALTGCRMPPPDRAADADGPGCVAFEATPLEPLAPIGELVPTHAVRAQAYACVDAEWQAIGGLAYAHIDAAADVPVASGVVKTGANAPWPYENIAARMGFNFPVAIQSGISVTISATFRSFLDADEMLACWLVDPAGVEIPGTRDQDTQTERGLAEVNCWANIGGTR